MPDVGQRVKSKPLAVFIVERVSYCAGCDVYTTGGHYGRRDGVTVGVYQFWDFGGEHALLCGDGPFHLKINLISAEARKSVN